MSELFVNTVSQNGKTVMSDYFFTSPCKVAKPFYRDDGYTEIMVMCASPGMLAGDRYNIRFDFSDNTKTAITEQSYRKLYNTGGDAAEQNIQIQAGENAALRYIPRPVVPFAGSRFRSRTEISLRSSSKMVFGEIFTCGRHGMGERFAFSEYSSRTVVSVDGNTVFLDNTRMIGGEADFSGLGFFEGYSCCGMFYIYGFGRVSLPDCGEVQAAVSKSSAGYTVRALSGSADSLYRFAERLKGD